MPTIQVAFTDDQLAQLLRKAKAAGFQEASPYLYYLAFPPKWLPSDEQLAAKLMDKIIWFVGNHPMGASRREIAQYIGGQTEAFRINAALCALVSSSKLVVKREKRSRKSTSFYYKP